VGLQELQAMPRILRRDPLSCRQDLSGALAQILEISDRCGNDV
jgi:hypothetical protein